MVKFSAQTPATHWTTTTAFCRSCLILLQQKRTGELRLARATNSQLASRNRKHLLPIRRGGVPSFSVLKGIRDAILRFQPQIIACLGNHRPQRSLLCNQPLPLCSVITISFRLERQATPRIDCKRRAKADGKHDRRLSAVSRGSMAPCIRPSVSGPRSGSGTAGDRSRSGRSVPRVGPRRESVLRASPQCGRPATTPPADV